MAIYYILKVKGKAKIPDYIQVRDESFTLIGYFRPERSSGFSNSAQSKAGMSEELLKKIEEVAPSIPFGEITKINL